MHIVPRNVISKRPCCTAVMLGTESHPKLHGTVSFFATGNGSVVVAELFQLPSPQGVFAMHIHDGTSCTGNKEDPFADAGTHMNLTNTVHPFHTGDLPPMFSNDGYAWSAFYTNRFQPMQVKNHVVILHAKSDDFRTQPGGNAGEKIACGVIQG